jgi:iron complex transport system substrate-binding protein
VSLIASSTEIACALDCGELLVGRSHECDHPDWVRQLPVVTTPRFDTAATSREIDRSVRALVEQALSVYHVDAAALAALRPDVILTQVQCEVCAVSRRDVEAALGEVVASRPRLVALEPNALADLWRDMRLVADALGVPERGVQLVSRLVRRTRAIAERAAAHPRPRVACIEWIDPLMIAGNWTPELVALAGAEDVLGRPGVHAGTVPLAALAEADPDAIFVTPCGFDLERTRAEMPALEREPLWQGLRAVREGRVFLADGNAIFNRPGPRVAEALEVLAEALHPGAFRFGHEGRAWERRAGGTAHETTAAPAGGRWRAHAPRG